MELRIGANEKTDGKRSVSPNNTAGNKIWKREVAYGEIRFWRIWSKFLVQPNTGFSPFDKQKNFCYNINIRLIQQFLLRNNLLNCIT